MGLDATVQAVKARRTDLARADDISYRRHDSRTGEGDRRLGEGGVMGPTTSGGRKDMMPAADRSNPITEILGPGESE